MGKQRVDVTRLSWDAECFSDLIHGKGFIISDPPTFEWEGAKMKPMFGPQSPLFGTSISDEQELAMRYRCQCGEFTGAMFEGETCPKCGKEVEFRDIDPNVTGWIPLGKHKVINPLYYRILSSTIGESRFVDMVRSKQAVDRNGIRSKPTKEQLADMNPTSPFYGIGIEEFRFQFYDVLDWVEKKNKKKKETIDILRQESCKVFTSHIPVYTPLLRQSSVSGDSYYYTGIDREINPLCSLSRDLENCQDIDRAFILERMQQRVNNMWDINFAEINTKDGFIRDQISGGSLNYSSRNVIIPDPTLRDNEVDLSYNAAHALLRFQIIYALMKTSGISLAKANEIWESGHIYNERVYKIINYILETQKPMVVINRNPTLRSNLVSLNCPNAGNFETDNLDIFIGSIVMIMLGILQVPTYCGDINRGKE